MSEKGTPERPLPKTFVFIDVDFRKDVIAERGKGETPHTGPWKRIEPGPGFDWQLG